MSETHWFQDLLDDVVQWEENWNGQIDDQSVVKPSQPSCHDEGSLSSIEVQDPMKCTFTSNANISSQDNDSHLVIQRIELMKKQIALLEDEISFFESYSHGDQLKDDDPILHRSFPLLNQSSSLTMEDSLMLDHHPYPFPISEMEKLTRINIWHASFEDKILEETSPLWLCHAKACSMFNQSLENASMDQSYDSFFSMICDIGRGLILLIQVSRPKDLPNSQDQFKSHHRLSINSQDEVYSIESSNRIRISLLDGPTIFDQQSLDLSKLAKKLQSEIESFNKKSYPNLAHFILTLQRILYPN